MCSAAQLAQDAFELSVLVMTLERLQFCLQATEHGLVALKPALHVEALKFTTLLLRPEMRREKYAWVPKAKQENSQFVN